MTGFGDRFLSQIIKAELFGPVAALVALLLAQLAPAQDRPVVKAAHATAAISTPTPISADDMRKHIEYLASPQMKGRSGQQAIAAGNFIADWFQKHGLQPLFDGSYFQPVTVAQSQDGQPALGGRNVGGYVAGSDPKLKDEVIVINAHYDHLGVREGKIYPGADDNASGVAMLLECARQIASTPAKPKRTIVFVAFDLEEQLLWGSRWFVEHPPWDIDRVKLCLTADMIGRSLGGLKLPIVFVLGSERAPRLKQVLADVGAPQGLETALLGIDLIGSRSDYAPFRDREIPFLFFSTGEHPDYHQPTDTPDRINYEKAADVANVILAVARRTADLEQPPKWIGPEQSAAPDVAEAEALHRITELLLEADDMGTYQLNSVQRFFVSQVEAKTAYIVRRGSMSQEERNWLARSAQFLLLSVF